jgi:hypothetical protein
MKIALSGYKEPPGCGKGSLAYCYPTRNFKMSSGCLENCEICFRKKGTELGDYFIVLLFHDALPYFKEHVKRALLPLCKGIVR